MRINSSGEVLIASTVNPDGKLLVNNGTNKNVQIRGSIRLAGSSIQSIQDDMSSDSPLEIYVGGSQLQLEGNPISFYNGGERMRITSAGEVCINTTGSSYGGLTNIVFNGNTQVGLKLGNTYSASYPTNNILFENHTGGVSGTISQTSSTSVAYNTSSDYRLKENVNYNFDATTRLKQLKPARFNFKADANRTVDGFLAHEVQDIIPEAICGTKDQTVTKEKVVVNVYGNVIAENIEQADWEAGKIPNEEGKSQYPVDSTWEVSKVVPVYQGIDQSKLTPLLTKALQEAIAKIEQLEARLTALES